VTAALVVLLGLSAPLRAPDLQVEATTTAGAALPELADAISRALVASGARVVLRGPSSDSCLYCAKVAVIEAEQGSCRVEVSQERHTASAALNFPAGSPLFDRARAIAIQARLLVTWETGPDSRAKEGVARPSTRRPERKILVEDADPETRVATAGTAPFKEAGLVSGARPESIPVRSSDPVVVPERRGDTVLVAPVTYADRTGAQLADRAQPQKSETARARPQRAQREEVVAVSLEPQKRQWPWIPTILGSGAAVAAGICAIVSRDRYNALSDRSQPYQTAQALKGEGQNWQIASFVLSGVALAGVSTGLIGFVMRSPERASLSAVAAPMPGGAMLAVAGEWP